MMLLSNNRKYRQKEMRPEFHTARCSFSTFIYAAQLHRPASSRPEARVLCISYTSTKSSLTSTWESLVFPTPMTAQPAVRQAGHRDGRHGGYVRLGGRRSPGSEPRFAGQGKTIVLVDLNIAIACVCIIHCVMDYLW